jgi:hypothetical protein
MNAKSEESTPNSMPAWYEPFPEPRTIPGGWDLSEYFTVAPLAQIAPNNPAAQIPLRNQYV